MDILDNSLKIPGLKPRIPHDGLWKKWFYMRPTMNKSKKNQCHLVTVTLYWQTIGPHLTWVQISWYNQFADILLIDYRSSPHNISQNIGPHVTQKSWTQTLSSRHPCVESIKAPVSGFNEILRSIDILSFFTSFRRTWWKKSLFHILGLKNGHTG